MSSPGLRTAMAFGVAVTVLAALVLGPVLTAGAQDSQFSVQRHAGPTRTDTAAAVSAYSYPGGAGTVVLARADAYGDALTAAPLAAALQAPVLLTSVERLDAAAAAEI